MEADSSTIASYGLELTGRLPKNEKEIAISDLNLAKLLNDYSPLVFNRAKEAIGMKYEDHIITGVFNTNYDFKRYKGTNLNGNWKLYNEKAVADKNGLHSVSFVAKGTHTHNNLDNFNIKYILFPLGSSKKENLELLNSLSVERFDIDGKYAFSKDEMIDGYSYTYNSPIKYSYESRATTIITTGEVLKYTAIAVLAVFIIYSYFFIQKLIRSNSNEIGVYRSLGYRGKDLYKLFIIAPLIIFIGTIIICQPIAYLILRLLCWYDLNIGNYLISAYSFKAIAIPIELGITVVLLLIYMLVELAINLRGTIKKELNRIE